MFRSVAVVSVVAVAVLVTGCTTAPAPPTGAVASTPMSATTASFPASASAASSPAETPVPMPHATIKVINISLKNGKATPNGDRLPLAQNTILRLAITSDHDDEVHVHGYDVEIAVKAGATVTKDITLQQLGRFEIESHVPPLTILQLVVS